MTEITRISTAQFRQDVSFDLRPDDAELTTLVEELGLIALRKVRLTGHVVPDGPDDIHLKGRLGATVVQPCVVTGAPVTTRLEEDVIRRYIADFTEPEADEVEMEEDDSREAMPHEIVLDDVMREALALALPDWPRSEGLGPVDMTVTEPGIAPMHADDVKPFAGLKALRDKLADKDDPGSEPE